MLTVKWLLFKKAIGFALIAMDTISLSEKIVSNVTQIRMEEENQNIHPKRVMGVKENFAKITVMMKILKMTIEKEKKMWQLRRVTFFAPVVELIILLVVIVVSNVINPRVRKSKIA